MCGSENKISPERIWQLGLKFKSSCYVKQMLVFPFSSAILLRGVWTSSMMNSPYGFQKKGKFLIDKLRTIVCSNSLYSFMKLSLNICHKVLNQSRYLTLMSKQKYLSSSRIVIYYCKKIIAMTMGILSVRSPDV